eukprot:1551032-Ditylum_brightwellii.AAC.2
MEELANVFPLHLPNPEVHCKDGKLDILPITSAEQTADIFTKSLPDQVFEYLRKKLMRWRLVAQSQGSVRIHTNL